MQTTQPINGISRVTSIQKLLSNKRKSLIDACHNMGESQMLYIKWKAEHTRPCGV